MPDDDWALSQGTVDFRNEERRWNLGRDEYHCLIDESAGMADLSFCTSDDNCQAEPDHHLPWCPVEERLREELGF